MQLLQFCFELIEHRLNNYYSNLSPPKNNGFHRQEHSRKTSKIFQLKGILRDLAEIQQNHFLISRYFLQEHFQYHKEYNLIKVAKTRLCK